MTGELHVRVNLKFKLNGEPIEHLKTLAENAIQYLLGNGQFTAYTAAEITEWTCSVEPPKDKHVVVTDEVGGHRAFGVFDGAKQAWCAFPEGKVMVIALEPLTDEMRTHIREAGEK